MSDLQAKLSELMSKSPSPSPSMPQSNLTGGNSELLSGKESSVYGGKRRHKHNKTKHNKTKCGGNAHGKSYGGKKTRHNRRKSHTKHKHHKHHKK